MRDQNRRSISEGFEEGLERHRLARRKSHSGVETPRVPGFGDYLDERCKRF